MESLAEEIFEFDFEALKEGKFAVIEPILGIELPITVALSLFILKENISFLEKEFNTKIIVENADKFKHDKSKFALPNKPAIIIE